MQVLKKNKMFHTPDSLLYIEKVFIRLLCFNVIPQIYEPYWWFKNLSFGLCNYAKCLCLAMFLRRESLNKFDYSEKIYSRDFF